jgi:hypothetical protein
MTLHETDALMVERECAADTSASRKGATPAVLQRLGSETGRRTQRLCKLASR